MFFTRHIICLFSRIPVLGRKNEKKGLKRKRLTGKPANLKGMVKESCLSGPRRWVEGAGRLVLPQKKADWLISSSRAERASEPHPP
jgi:hypothetical protein